VTRALAHPALQVLGAAGALLVFTWPFLVFDRPIQVFLSFFITWPLIIGVLFAFSRANGDAETEALESASDEQDHA
jgi:hypothetical protein